MMQKLKFESAISNTMRKTVHSLRVKLSRCYPLRLPEEAETVISTHQRCYVTRVTLKACPHKNIIKP